MGWVGAWMRRLYCCRPRRRSWHSRPRLFEAIPALRGCVPIRSMTYPVYASPLLFACDHSSLRGCRSARGATLGNGGWLDPYHAGTFTRPDAPRFARRANAEPNAQGKASEVRPSLVAFRFLFADLIELILLPQIRRVNPSRSPTLVECLLPA
jgi:hypothetical protein